jgi:hypothetical protein
MPSHSHGPRAPSEAPSAASFASSMVFTTRGAAEILRRRAEEELARSQQQAAEQSRDSSDPSQRRGRPASPLTSVYDANMHPLPRVPRSQRRPTERGGASYQQYHSYVSPRGSEEPRYGETQPVYPGDHVGSGFGTDRYATGASNLGGDGYRSRHTEEPDETLGLASLSISPQIPERHTTEIQSYRDPRIASSEVPQGLEDSEEEDLKWRLRDFWENKHTEPYTGDPRDYEESRGKRVTRREQFVQYSLEEIRWARFGGTTIVQDRPRRQLTSVRSRFTLAECPC